jgi:hypothetical protein
MNNIQPNKKIVNAVSKNILNFFYKSLPKSLYCSDFKSANHKDVKKNAYLYKYISPNHAHRQWCLIIDLDYPDAMMIISNPEIPKPNIICNNTDNGHSHFFYLLKKPVTKSKFTRQAPIRYAAAVESALTSILKGDEGFSGLLCKNPLCNFWETFTCNDKTFTLSELSEKLDLKFKNNKVPQPILFGLGRNCSLFDEARVILYSDFRLFDVENRLNEFKDYAYNLCLRLNFELFPCPLPEQEVKWISTSIVKYCYSHLSKKGFSSWCEKQQAKSLYVRREKSIKKFFEIVEYKKIHPELKYRELSIIFNCSIDTVKRAFIFIRQNPSFIFDDKQLPLL